MQSRNGPAAASPLRLPPLSLYVHIPWCVRKCPYCDFNSHESTNLPEADYVAALIRDLQVQRDWAGGRELQSIFFGGGTPSLFSGRAIGDILDAVARHLPLAPQIEITLEANPGTIEQQRFVDYRAAGVNRLSIGVQSFQAEQLRALGRIHGADEALAGVAAARSAGFDNINVDLMHGLPGQTAALALADLEQALALEVEHLSWYQLTIEPNTAFYSRPPRLPDDDSLADILDAGLARLERAGLARYEVSAYARGVVHQSRHNLNYWNFGDYLGIGAGAHGKLSDVGANRISRYNATRLPRDYIAGAGRHWPLRHLDNSERAAEFMLNALRLAGGFDRALFRSRTGLEWQAVADIAERQHQLGLLELEGDRIRPSARGFDFLNDLVAAFL